MSNPRIHIGWSTCSIMVREWDLIFALIPTATSAESSPLDTPELRIKELDSNNTEPDDSEFESKEVQQQLEKDDEKDDEDRESLEGAPDKDSITLPTFSTTSAFLAPFPILQPPFTSTSPQFLAPRHPRTPIKAPPNPKVLPQPSLVQRRMTGTNTPK
ncbi:hypothetical protein DFH29DRAFT_1051616 [Suillus ampliporus]|nr:hypothetical protein DFH29DRAFT_1051616 [Suillus ampliporus]